MTRSESFDERARPVKLPKLFGGSANPLLNGRIAEQFSRLTGLEFSLSASKVGRFADGEVSIEVKESVRGHTVYLLAPTCANATGSVNEHLVELLLLVSCMRRASARSITAVIPYFAYARQDRKMAGRVPISAADVARLLETAGVDRVIAVDLHCGQIQGFFSPRVPCDNLAGASMAIPYFGRLIADRAAQDGQQIVRPVVIAPDAGAVARAKTFRNGLSAYVEKLVRSGGSTPEPEQGDALTAYSRARTMANEANHPFVPGPSPGSRGPSPHPGAAAAPVAPTVGLAMIIKQRSGAGKIGSVDLVGNVKGCDAIIVDDMIDTAGTLCAAAGELIKFGARRVYAFASHGLFNGPAPGRIAKSQLHEVVVLDTVPLRPACQGHAKIRQISVAPLLAEAIRRTHFQESMSTLFTG